MNDQEQLSLKEKELLLKEKEIELRERELKLKEQEFRQSEEKKQKVEDAFNAVRQKITPSRRQGAEGGGIFSLRKADNANIFSSEGVLGRKGFFFFMLLYCTVYYVAVVLLGEVAQDPNLTSLAFGIFYFAIIVVGAIPIILADIKRCRDCDLNEWWLLIFSIIPITGIYLLFAKTQVNLENYTSNWDTYRLSDEYKETQKRGKQVLWTIIALYVLFLLLSAYQGFVEGMNG